MNRRTEWKDWSRNLRIRIALLPFVTTMLVSAVFGQANQGSIAGNVLDPSDAVVARAKITATDASRGTT